MLPHKSSFLLDEKTWIPNVTSILSTIFNTYSLFQEGANTVKNVHGHIEKTIQLKDIAKRWKLRIGKIQWDLAVNIVTGALLE